MEISVAEMRDILTAAGLPRVSAYSIASAIESRTPELARIALKNHVSKLIAEQDEAAAAARRTEESKIDELAALDAEIAAALQDPAHPELMADSGTGTDRAVFRQMLHDQQRRAAFTDPSAVLSDSEAQRLERESAAAMGIID